MEIFSAWEAGNLALVKTLLRRDPSLLNKKDGKDSWTPLLCACYYDQQAVVRYLLNKGAAMETTYAIYAEY